jgi:hypothetical protein
MAFLLRSIACTTRSGDSANIAFYVRDEISGVAQEGEAPPPLVLPATDETLTVA